MAKSFKWSTQHLLDALRVPNEKYSCCEWTRRKNSHNEFATETTTTLEWMKKGDEMKANDNHFLAWIHIHCSNMERESVEISAHQAINMASVSIFPSHSRIFEHLVFRSIGGCVESAKRLLSLWLQDRSIIYFFTSTANEFDYLTCRTTKEESILFSTEFFFILIKMLHVVNPWFTRMRNDVGGWRKKNSARLMIAENKCNFNWKSSTKTPKNE